MVKKGEKLTREHRGKIGQGNKKAYKEGRRKVIKPTHWRGKKFNKKHKENLSKAHTGKKKPWAGKHKPSQETKARMSIAKTKEKHPNWKGGLTCELYTIDWTKTLRRSIRERDRYTCQLCKTLQSDRAFDVHHIDYNKKNCNPDNLITLCRICHLKTNYNRKYWINYFNKENKLI